MNLHSPTILRFSPLVLAIGITAVAGACSKDRVAFRSPPQDFDTEEITPDAGECGLRCSIDGRNVIDNCTGAVVEECPPELACGTASCQDPCAAAAADQRSTGCDFYFQPPPSSPGLADGCYAAFVVNTSTLPVELTLERGGEVLDVSGAVYAASPGSSSLAPHSGPVPPGESVIVFLSDQSSPPHNTYEHIRCPSGAKVPVELSTPSNRRTSVGQSFRLTTTQPVALSTMYPFGGAASEHPSATLIQPVVSWAKENILINGWQVTQAGDPVTQIVAAHEDTKVTIHPRKDLVVSGSIPGSPAGIPITYTLNRGEFLQVAQADELTGSSVVSDKPTTTFGAHQCAFVPSARYACDTLSQRIPSFAQWGSEYASAGYRPRTEGDEQELMPYRIVAARDGTRFEHEPTIPPGAPTELQAGETALFPVTVGEGIVVRSQDAEHPFYLAAYMTGCTGGYMGTAQHGFPQDMGDPEFVNVVPAGQYLSSYSFYADATYRETSLVIVRQKAHGKLHDVELDCAGKLDGFRPLGSRGELEYVRIDLGRAGGPGATFGEKTCPTGLHRMQSEGPFTATIWGWDEAASYAYPGGTAHRKLVNTPLVPVN